MISSRWHWWRGHQTRWLTISRARRVLWSVHLSLRKVGAVNDRTIARIWWWCCCQYCHRSVFLEQPHAFGDISYPWIHDAIDYRHYCGHDHKKQDAIESYSHFEQNATNHNNQPNPRRIATWQATNLLNQQLKYRLICRLIGVRSWYFKLLTPGMT